jgi:hypothetical protein
LGETCEKQIKVQDNDLIIAKLIITYGYHDDVEYQKQKIDGVYFLSPTMMSTESEPHHHQYY